MKKIVFCGLSALSASCAFVQTASATATVNAGTCSISGVTSISTDYTTNTVTITGGTLGAGCSSTPSNVSLVSVTPASGSFSYTLGTTQAMTVSWSSTDTGVTCSIGNVTGFVSNPTATNNWSLTAPTAAGSYAFPLTCNTSTTGKTVSVSPSSVTMVAAAAPAPAPPPPPPTTGCDGTLTSDSVFGLTLTRQCTGTVTYSGGYFSKGTFNGNTYNLDDLLTDRTHLGSFPKYFSGYSMTPTLNSGQFIALKFTVSAEGQMQFTNDPSFGDAGTISVSTTPGRFTTAGGALCTQSAGASTSMLLNTPAVGPGDCNLKVGQTYYLNFAAVNSQGQNLCFNGTPNSGCGTTKVSFSELAATY